MKIVIAGGTHKADYIIGMYKTHHNELVVINENEEVCKWLSQKNDIAVFNGKPTKFDDLNDAGCKEADIFISLSNDDVENYIACKTAKTLLKVKKCVATVMNPKNVETFKKLGIDSVISSTYLLAQQIKNEAAIESLIKTLSLENDKIMIIEITISKNSKVCDKSLMNINISEYASISCIYRNGDVIIPNGSSVLKEGDKVLVVTTKNNEKMIIDFFSENDNEE